MSDQENKSPASGRKIKSNPLRPVLILFVILIVAVVAAGMFFFAVDRKSPETGLPEADTAVSPPAGIPLQPATPSIEPEPAPAEALPPPEEEPGPPEEPSPEKQCAALAEQLNGFFTHLDGREYMRSFRSAEPSREYFTALAYRLLDNPPVVTRESDDLYTILKNMAHFFRVIGKDNILLIKTILDRERDKIEDVARDIYLWSTREDCDPELFDFAPELAKMYEYAGFFLNTMGGRSYLFRRDSRSRLVVNYYSVLLVDLANDKGINRHGLDIAQIIPQLVEEIESSNKLIYKETYLDQLYALLEQYQ